MAAVVSSVEQALSVFVVEERFTVLKFDTYLGYTFAAYVSIYLSLLVYITAGEVACIPRGADVALLLDTATEDLTGLSTYRNLVCATQIKWHATFLYVLHVAVLAVTAVILYNNAKLTQSINALLHTEFEHADEAERFRFRANMHTMPAPLRGDDDSSIKYGIDRPTHTTAHTLVRLITRAVVPAVYTRYSEARHEFYRSVPRRFIERFHVYWTAKTIQAPLFMLALLVSVVLGYAVPSFRRILLPSASLCEHTLTWASDISVAYECHFQSEFAILVLWVLLQAVSACMLVLMVVSWVNATLLVQGQYAYERQRFDATGGTATHDSDPTSSGASVGI